jgi:hypothetical protein
MTPIVTALIRDLEAAFAQLVATLNPAMLALQDAALRLAA